MPILHLCPRVCPGPAAAGSLSAKAGRVDYLGVAGTAGKTTAAALTAAVLRAAGLVTGSYYAGCEPLSARIRVNGEPVAPELLAQAAET